MDILFVKLTSNMVGWCVCRVWLAIPYTGSHYDTIVHEFGWYWLLGTVVAKLAETNKIIIL